MLEICLQGMGGQGVVVGAEILGSAITKSGRYAQVIPVYSVARRGETVTAFIRVDDKQILERCDVYEPDLVVSFDSQFALETLAAGLKTEGGLLLNSVKAPSEISPVCALIGTVDADRIAAQVYGSRPIKMTNMAMCGALAKIAEFCPFDRLEEAIAERFTGENRSKSLHAAGLGYDTARKLKADRIKPVCFVSKTKQAPFPELPLSPVVYPWMLEAQKPSLWRSSSPEVNGASCRGCGLCCTLCPEGTIELRGGIAVVDHEYCKGCGICVEVCPFGAIKMVE